MVLALGYLLGVAPGGLVAVVGALALVTFGRVLWLGRAEAAVACIGLALAAAALGVGALRWGTLDLGEIRGAQAVLGPGILLAPRNVAIGSAVAVAGGVLGLALWLSGAREARHRAWIWRAAEASVAALALVSVFWGPAVVEGKPLLPELGRWVLPVAAVTLATGAGALGFRRAGRTWRWVGLAVTVVIVAAAAGVVGVSL